MGEKLWEEFQKGLSFQDIMSDDGFAIEPKDNKTSKKVIQWVHDWINKM
jgi:hypothetical protein